MSFRVFCFGSQTVFLVALRGLSCSAACEILVPRPRIKPAPLAVSTEFWSLGCQRIALEFVFESKQRWVSHSSREIFFFRVKDVTCDISFFSPSLDPSFYCLIRLERIRVLNSDFCPREKVANERSFCQQCPPPQKKNGCLGWELDGHGVFCWSSDKGVIMEIKNYM